MSGIPQYYHLSGWYWGIPDTRHSAPVAASGKSGQFQSGQFNEYEWLLSAKSSRSRLPEPTGAYKDDGGHYVGRFRDYFC